MIALLALLLAAAPGPAPAEGAERAVFHTVAGDMVFVLYPDAAPQTVEQFRALVKAGVYDTTTFARVKPGFVVQLASAADRRTPLTAAQAAMIKRLPVEPSAVKHEHGILSMVRKPQDPNSAETSFCILLGPAPQLDGKYTAFGRLESGEDVLQEMLKVPRDERMRPAVRLEVTHAELVPTTRGLAFAPAHAVPGAPVAARPSATLRGAAVPAPPDRRIYFLAAGLVLIGLLGTAKVLLGKRLAPRHMASLDLVGVLVSMFLLLVLLVPDGHRSPWLAAALFVALIAVFKLLGRFEAPADKA